MEQLHVTPSALRGTVQVTGAKNATLPALAAACLADGRVELANATLGLTDCQRLMQLLGGAGCEVMQRSAHSVSIDGSGFRGGIVPSAATRLRHSLLLLGVAAYYHRPLLLPVPGGCKLGDRKHDFHVDALRRLGFEVTEGDQGIQLNPGPTHFDAEVEFAYPSFGATFTAVFAACGRIGHTTVVHNAAINPEVIEVLSMLQSFGAKIEGLGTRTLKIAADAPLKASDHVIGGDRIVAATLCAAVGAAGGEVTVSGCAPSALESEIAVWRGAGLNIEACEGGFQVAKTQTLQATQVETAAFPAFHTDIQPLHGAMMATAEGTSTIKETILDGRFRYAGELNEMGARCTTRPGNFTCVNGAPGQVLEIEGVGGLRGAEVRAHDIRGGAALVVAALGAEGETVISNVEQIDRGYERIETLFHEAGGSVRRVEAGA